MYDAFCDFFEKIVVIAFLASTFVFLLVLLYKNKKQKKENIRLKEVIRDLREQNNRNIYDPEVNRLQSALENTASRENHLSNVNNKLNLDLNTLNHTTEELKCDNNRLWLKYRILQNENDNLQKENLKLTKKDIDSRNKLLDIAKNRMDISNSEIESLKETISRLERKKLGLENRIRDLEDQLKEKNDKNVNLINEINKLKDKIEELRHSINLLNENKSSLESQLKQKTNMIDDQNNEMIKLKKITQSNQSRHLCFCNEPSLHTRINEWSDANEILNKKKEEKKHCVQHLKNHIDYLTGLINQNNNLQNELNTLDNNLNNLNNAFTTMNNAPHMNFDNEPHRFQHN